MRERFISRPFLPGKDTTGAEIEKFPLPAPAVPAFRGRPGCLPGSSDVSKLSLLHSGAADGIGVGVGVGTGVGLGVGLGIGVPDSHLQVLEFQSPLVFRHSISNFKPEGQNLGVGVGLGVGLGVGVGFGFGGVPIVNVFGEPDSRVLSIPSRFDTYA